MKTLRYSIIALLPLALMLGGCGSETGENPNNTTDSGPTTPDNGVNPGKFEATLVMETPNGIAGDFLVFGEVVCSNTTSCTHTVIASADYDIAFECPTHLFRDYTAKVAISDNGSTHTFDWSDPGAWGWAPNGTYVDQFGAEHKVKTVFVDDKVMTELWFKVNIVDNEFTAMDPSYGTMVGTISNDYKQISYTVTGLNGNVLEVDLTLLE